MDIIGSVKIVFKTLIHNLGKISPYGYEHQTNNNRWDAPITGQYDRMINSFAARKREKDHANHQKYYRHDQFEHCKELPKIRLTFEG